ncbi:unnamed protein product, partial [Prorocentrum cordatum]
LAAGRHKQHLEELVHQCAGLLLTRCQKLPPADRDFIIRDWEGARTALAEVVEMKFSHWDFLPYRFCALGFVDRVGTGEGPARAALAACLEQYAAMSAEQRNALWPLAAQEPALLDTLSADIAYLRTSPDRLLQAFSLHAHPTILSEQAMRGWSKISTVGKVIYRLDRQTQQARHRVLADAMRPAPKSPDKPKPRESPNHGARLISVHAMQHFRKTCRKDIFYSIAAPAASLATLQSALSGTRSRHDPPLLPLGDDDFTVPALLPKPADGGHVDGVHSETVPEELVTCLEERMVPPQHHAIFKVVHKAPKTRHVVTTPNSNLCSEDMSVSLHDIVAHQVMQDGSVEVLVALTGARVGGPALAAEGEEGGTGDPHASTRLLTRRHLEALPRLDQNLLAWEPEGGIFYAPWPWPSGLPVDMRSFAAEVFTDLVIAEALPGSASSFISDPIEVDSPPELRVLEHLEELGMVSRAEHPGPHVVGISWNFTEYGLNSASALEKLRRPAPALKKREGIPDKETVFELLLDASSAGWHGRLLPPKKHKQPPPAPYDPSTSEKVWYFSRSRASISHLYLRLLLGGQEVVPHEGGADACMKLSGLQPKLRLAIQDDAGEADPKPKKRRRIGNAMEPLPLLDTGVANTRATGV